MADFIIRIPRLSVAVSEATLLEVLVGEDAYVEEGQGLFVVETDKVESEIEAGASGIVHWTGTVETVYDIGTQIGTISEAH